MKNLFATAGNNPKKPRADLAGIQHLQRRLDEASLEVVLANPVQARRFARSMGQLAKTDRIDAAMLALFGRLPDRRRALPLEPNLQHLKDLVAARAACVEDRVDRRKRIAAFGPVPVAAALGRFNDAAEREIGVLANALLRDDRPWQPLVPEYLTTPDAPSPPSSPGRNLRPNLWPEGKRPDSRSLLPIPEKSLTSDRRLVSKSV